MQKKYYFKEQHKMNIFGIKKNIINVFIKGNAYKITIY